MKYVLSVNNGSVDSKFNDVLKVIIAALVVVTTSVQTQSTINLINTSYFTSVSNSEIHHRGVNMKYLYDTYNVVVIQKAKHIRNIRDETTPFLVEIPTCLRSVLEYVGFSNVLKLAQMS